MKHLTPLKRRTALVLGTALVSVAIATAPAEAKEKRSWLEAMIEDTVSSDQMSVDVVGLDGLLSSTAKIEKIILSDVDGPWLEIDGANLDWTRSALARKRLEIKELSARKISLLRKPHFPQKAPTASSTPGLTIPSLPDLPVAINIGKISAPELFLGADVAGEEVTLGILGQARLANGSAFLKLDLDQIGGGDGVDLLASYGGESHELSLSLDLVGDESGLISRKLGLPGAPSIALTLEGQGPVTDFEATTSLATAGEDRVAGTLRIEPREVDGSVSFDADISGDLLPLVPKDLHDFFGEKTHLKVAGSRKADGQFELSNLALSARSLELQGKLRTDANARPVDLDLTAQIASPDAEHVTLPFTGSGTSIQDASLSLTYTAIADPSAQDAWLLSGKINDLQTKDATIGAVTVFGNGPLPDASSVLKGHMGLQLSGLDLAQDNLQAAVGDNTHLGLNFDAEASGALKLSDLQVEAEDQLISGDATLRGLKAGETPHLEAKLDVSSSDFSRYSGLAGRDISGSGHLETSISAAPLAGAFDVSIDGKTDSLRIGDPRADVILSQPTQLSITAKRDTLGVHLDQISVQNARTNLTGNGSIIGQDATFALSGRLSDTSDILAGPSGEVELVLNAQKHGENISANGSASAPGEVTLTFSTSATMPVGGGKPSFAGQGTVHAGDISPYGMLTGLPLSGSGALDLNYSGDLDAMAFDVSVDGNTQDLKTGIEQADALLQGKTKLLASVSLLEDVLAIHSLDVANPQIFLTGKGDMSGTDGTIEIDGRLSDTALLLPDFPGETRIMAKLHPAGDRIALLADATGPGGTAIKVTGDMSRDAKDLDIRLTGAAPAGLANPFIAPRRVGGKLDLSMAIDGAASIDNIKGSVRVAEGDLSLPNLRLAVRELDAEAELSDGVISVNLDGKPAKGGKIAVEGSIDILNNLESDISVLLDKVGASDPALYDTDASGKITIAGPLATGAKISGKIELGETILQIPEALAGSYGPIPGLIHLREAALSHLARERAGFLETGAEDASGSTPVSHDLDLRIDAPARIFIRGRGLDAELGGQLRIGGTTAHPLPSGAFELRRGRLDILGQRLDLSEGLLRMEGDFDPYLRFVADSTTEIGTARIVIEGSASAPTLTLSSSPALPQDEVLSMLLFGKSVTDMTAIEALKLANAVRTLTGGGGEGLMGKVRGTLGLDDLDVSSTADGAPQVGVGKYLAEGVYANTSVATSGETRIELNYEINSRLTARGQATSTGTAGLGLFFERNY